MSKTYLVTRPEHDTTTHYLSYWNKEMINAAQKKGMKVLDLNREDANRQKFESMIIKMSPNLVVLNGHGDDNTVTGHNNQPLVKAGENESLLKSKIVYALSCRSAKILGPKSVESGAISYTGYDDDFIFSYEPENISRPLHDGTAKLFLEPSNLFVDSLIKGNTVDESRKRTENLLRKNLVKSLGSTIADASLARFLWWDLRHFVSHGNMDATL
ncbi:MAG: hypothetical protein ABIF85_03650 [Nanoarchaeota archaeon]|nr:hypothetical protein [Nanoarchaeota archaeon]MBU4300947.1 hypothetical protein [Nanoarchaeota archaeon]MBU4452261.1 hypothetical protein [Nanoarchaeota archaeon]MCG2724531.1 hypothetical protein [archaeon]